jgi:hypothetical protein
MRLELGISAAFERWADEAGFSMTESSTDGRAIVWTAGGETRFFIEKEESGWVVVTSSERMGEDQFELAAIHPSLIERRFIADFAYWSVRSKRGLLPLSLPNSADDLAAGYLIGRKAFWRIDRFTLVDPHGRKIAVVSGGELIGTMNVVELSIFASSDLGAIVRSLTDPVGKPLFSVRHG